MVLNKNSGLVLLLLLFLVTLMQVVAEQGDLEIDISDVGEIIRLQPYKLNDYYLQTNYYGVSADELNYSLIDVSLFSETEMIQPQYYGLQKIVFKNVHFDDSYTITINGKAHPLYFCNNNNKCDVCNSGFCSILENSLTCPNDCASGGDDSYCDLQLDGVCDPDCDNMDFDCDSCVGSSCTYEGKIEPKTTCDEKGGMICNVNQRCKGTLTYTDDAGAFCCIGTCYDKTIKTILVEEPIKTSSSQFIEATQEDSSQETTDSTINEMEKKIDSRTFIYIIILIIFLIVGVVAAVFFETQAIKKEHKIRQYVYGLIQKGYSLEQIKTSLVQQNIEPGLIKKIMRLYKK